MFIRYSLHNMTEHERALFGQIMLEEMESQTWFGIAVSNLLGRELVVSLH